MKEDHTLRTDIDVLRYFYILVTLGPPGLFVNLHESNFPSKLTLSALYPVSNGLDTRITCVHLTFGDRPCD